MSVDVGQRQLVVAGDVPVELRGLDQWVPWRYEQRPGDPKPTKVPYQARSPRTRASTTDPRGWAPLELALAVLETGTVDGIGFVFSAEDPFVGVDFDHCVQGGKLNPFVRGLINALDSYAEFSPSGTGVHQLVRAELAGGSNVTGRTPWGGKLEIYAHSRYFTFTGWRVPGTPDTINDAQRRLERVRAALLPVKLPPRRVPAPTAPALADDRDLVEVASRATNGAAFEALWRGDQGGFESHSEADLSLCVRLCFYAGGDGDRIDRLFRSSGLMRPKWDVKKGDSTYGERTIAKAIAGCSNYYRARA